MFLPTRLITYLKQHLNTDITGVDIEHGGDINKSFQLQTAHGKYFLKTNKKALPGMFAAEAKGLKELKKAKSGLRIPEVILNVEQDGIPAFILMEYIDEQAPTDKNDAAYHFGQLLAVQHKYTHEKFGLDHDNYIGSLPQKNSQTDDWAEFFVRYRLEPQLRMAVDKGLFPNAQRAKFDNLFKKLPEIFPEAPASLLHGDLWSGNYMFTTDEATSIYDPAVYYGHHEVDLAMSVLFGGFPSSFYEGYHSLWPLDKTWKDRSAYFNLYPLLVHCNLFGASYVTQVNRILHPF